MHIFMVLCRPKRAAQAVLSDAWISAPYPDADLRDLRFDTVVTAVYVGYSLWSQAWNISWIIWPVAGILFGAIAGFVSLRQKSGD